MTLRAVDLLPALMLLGLVVAGSVGEPSSSSLQNKPPVPMQVTPAR